MCPWLDMNGAGHMVLLECLLGWCAARWLAAYNIIRALRRMLPLVYIWSCWPQARGPRGVGVSAGRERIVRVLYSFVQSEQYCAMCWKKDSATGRGDGQSRRGKITVRRNNSIGLGLACSASPLGSSAPQNLTLALQVKSKW